jgi:hypothetical protein
MPLILNGTDGVQGNSGAFIADTAKASTSGTSVDFTGIPSWVKRVTVVFRGVSTSGTSNWLIQLGTGSTPTYTTTGYLGGALRLTDATAIAGANPTAGFGMPFVSANVVAHGNVTISSVDVTANAWAAAGTVGNSNASSVVITGGSIALSGALTAVRITTVSGTETFDAGTINILYE